MSTLQDPAQGVFAITPSSNYLETLGGRQVITRAIRCSGAGNLDIIGADGEAATCAFLAGETRAIRAQKVLATSTATGIEGMY